MRYLNKIVFINSASVPYAEIELDGNTHFTGNQGAGKTALLRAILFFYNADKTKLGIGREKSRFDEYYFPYQNSYIVYEVNRDNRKYTVLAYKVHGKTAFRFIDAPYRREFFITDDGMARESWDQIRDALLNNGVHFSKLVTGYEEYRKIIYGDNGDLNPAFRKYAIVESKQYQNIPRTIQNVFLNAKLDADFIKETIIHSLSDNVEQIDLENYARAHLRDFEQNIRDIQLWHQTGKDGRPKLRRQAENIIERHRIINFIRKEKEDAVRELKYRLDFIENRKPLTEENVRLAESRLEQIRDEIDKLDRLQREREIRLEAERKGLKDRLKEIREKEKFYREQNIEDILRKVAQKEYWLQRKQQLIEEKNLLESRFAGVREKYDALIRNLENQLDAFRNLKEKERNEQIAALNGKKLEILEKYRGFTDEIRRQFSEMLEEKRRLLEERKDKEAQLREQKVKIQHKDFFREERETLETRIRRLEEEIREYNSETETAEREIEHLIKQSQWEEREIEREFDARLKEKRQEREQFEKHLDEIRRKIQQSRHSLYAWLNEHHPDWENHIGKVIDEEILYRDDLRPERAPEGGTDFFGVRLDLTPLKRKVKTVAELKEEAARTEDAIRRTETALHKILSEKEEALKKLRTKFNAKINKLKDTVAQRKIAIQVNEQKRKQLTGRLDELREQARTRKERELARIEEGRQKLAVETDRIRLEMQNLREKEKKEIRILEQKLKKELNELESRRQALMERIQKEIEAKIRETGERIARLKQQKSEELSRQGADTGRLREIESQLEEVQKALDFIEAHYKLTVEYAKDKRELLDRKDEFQNRLKDIENRLASLQQQYAARKQKLRDKENEQRRLTEALKQELRRFEQDLEAFENFRKSEVFAGIEPVWDTAEPMETDKTATAVIDFIKEKHYRLIRDFDELKRLVHLFAGQFDENNLFKFKVLFPHDRDYFAFAENLKEFLEEDKLSEFEKRVSERFAGIITQIGRETGALVSKEAEIEKVIKKINADFRRKNFVKAIKEMEIRMRKSNNPVVQLLMKIKDFNDEYGHLLGEANLFSTADTDNKNREAVALLQKLVKRLREYKHPVLTVSDTFDLEFRIVENDNDSGWVEKLSHVGSEGTDVLIKAMVNILLLNVFKESASRKFKDFKLHCLMDEIGRLHPVNVKGILRFANERNIYLINSSPVSQNAMDYKYVYKLSKEPGPGGKHYTRVVRLLKVT